MSDPTRDFFSNGEADGAAKITLVTHPERLSRKQSAIMRVVRDKGSITLAEATALVGGNVYHNQTKHTGALIANMVRRGLLERFKAGWFILPKKP